MKITILNGNMNSETEIFSVYLTNFSAELSKNHSVKHFQLKDMNIKQCLGCWNCWWKTPGKCTTKDDAGQILESIINSDLVIFASPVTAGFTSSVLKKISDRMVSLLHPYIKIREKECHHRKRYDKYPNFGVLLMNDEDTDFEDTTIIMNIYERFALNFHSNIKFLFQIEQNPIEDIIYEINNI
ncbi:MAG: NAD(P)H-dependent oxidoreductase [Bacteroidota bacterium]|nr:NAD(P)H-dependent oxidoreductase [Bacteroidota bacterium]